MVSKLSTTLADIPPVSFEAILKQIHATVKVSLFKSRSDEITWLTVPEVGVRSPNADDGTPKLSLRLQAACDGPAEECGSHGRGLAESTCVGVPSKAMCAVRDDPT